jgi:endonuclease G
MLSQTLSRLRTYNARVRKRDPKLTEESLDVLPEVLHEGFSDGAPLARAIAEESIILRRTRPVLSIFENEAKLVFVDPADSAIWLDRLVKAGPVLDNAIRAVGRIDLRGARLEWVGTGWLVAENVLVTNRHVAREFAGRNGEGFTFRVGLDGPIEADVDFLQEIDNPTSLTFRLSKVLHIEDEPGPDLAFFEVSERDGEARLATPIALADRVATTENAATVGYPAYDSRIPEIELMESIYGKLYNKKRLAPGGITRVDKVRVLHDCTTLGGNSGSVVVDLESGRALGLHFSGSFLSANYAVRADVVGNILKRVRSGRASRGERRREVPRIDAVRKRHPEPSATTITVPLTLSISIGPPLKPDLGGFRRSDFVELDDDSQVVAGEEAVAEDYRDRIGYQSDFLGDDNLVELPRVVRNSDDVLAFDFDGRRETNLRYEHYSVVMSRSRRMCFLSAVNIDGSPSRKSGRVKWKWDPRISRDQQIMNECYGNPPKFSRGHMTRREDPGWGDVSAAKRGNEDSMHVTNTTPQMQAFNSPIWLALEDYALQHAREDAMRISVFTGPYFNDRDPEMFGVQIPLAFWKVIVFVHDDTGDLCATGYEMSQDTIVQAEEEYVFGAFTSRQLNVATQVPIGSIEARSGISFGQLAGLDPLADRDEAIFAKQPEWPALEALEQIQFVS